LGFRVKLGRHALKTTDHTAGTARERASDLHDMFADNTVKAIVCAIGGNHSNQLLPLLDFDLIRSHPKIFVGYSDITVLHLAMLSRAGLQTFYGPALLTQFGENPQPLAYTRDNFLRCVMSPEPLGRLAPSRRWTEEFLDWGRKADMGRPRRLKPNPGPVWLSPGRARGALLGGCITSLMHLRGTPYWPKLDGAIFFWETPEGSDPGRGRSVADIESCLADLVLSGVFDQISGMVVGRPYGYGAEDTSALRAAVRRALGSRRMPVLFGADIGHTDPMLTLPMGVQARLDSSGEFSILEAGVR
jgi:muramoyltetrapeptide carboxypeptidase LdcA involved in peptidoglycan recycling